MNYAYPLKIKFRLIALAPRINVFGADKKELFYIEQKVFALKEAVKVYNNDNDKKLLYTIQANQIIDFSAKYTIKHADGHSVIGAVQREGMKSLFQATYTILDKNDQAVYKVSQNNPWIAVLDSIINIIPFAEFFTGFILNPVYEITEITTSQPLMTMKKKPGLFDTEFEIAAVHTKPDEQTEQLVLLSLLMIVQLEQNRG